MAKGMNSIETYKELINLGYSKKDVEQLLGFEIVKMKGEKNDN